MKDVKRAETITLDNLISVSSESALRAIQASDISKLKIKPRIWIGIWIDFNHDLPQLGDVGQGKLPTGKG